MIEVKYTKRWEEMGGKKTIDGVRLDTIVRAAEKLGIEVTDGGNHRYKLHYQGMRSCPVATSTHARRMLVPWLVKITEYTAKEVYLVLKKGYT